MTTTTDNDALVRDDVIERPDPATTSKLSPTVRTGIAAVLTLLIVLSGAAIAFLLEQRSDVEQSLDARHDVVRVAEQFTVRVNNYDSASVEDYKASVSEMLSTKFSDEFDKAMEDIVKSVQEAEMDSEGKVLASGVASLDQDSAQVLVVADADVKTVFDTRQRHFRWEISLVKVDGTWLVDDFTPVA
jgi:Mce-associated membrane protein